MKEVKRIQERKAVVSSKAITGLSSESGGLKLRDIAADSSSAYCYNPDNNLFQQAIKKDFNYYSTNNSHSKVLLVVAANVLIFEMKLYFRY